MTESTALITGGTSGLGRECARVLAADPGWHVLVTGRDPDRTARAAAAIGAHPVALDLGSLADVRRVAGELTGRLESGALPPLRALVANAGRQVVRESTTSDGVETTFGVNHLGHLALVEALVDRFVAPGRIVLVASGTHDPARRTGMPHPLETAAVAELAHPGPSGAGRARTGRRRYTTSKLANVRTGYVLAERLRERGITVNSFDPGLMPGTGLAGDAGPLARLVWRTAARALIALPGVHSARTSGADLAHLVGAPELAGVTGAYFERRRPAGSSRASYDARAAHELYRDSLQLIDALSG